METISVVLMTALSKTSALVMSWARPLYASGRAGRYLDLLDLSPAADLIAACDRICPWYGEVILNRKYQIKAWADEWLSSQGNDQVIILAAGIAPLSLELLEDHPRSRIIEVDVAEMAAKAAAFSGLFPDLDQRIEFIEADICSEGLLNDIYERTPWFDRNSPILVIMEGISYYIPERWLWKVVQGLSSGRKNRMILEYLVPEGTVDEGMRHIPIAIFGAIAKAAEVSSYSRYTPSDIQAIAQEAGGRVLADEPLFSMERLRKGHTERFPRECSGWIRCAQLEL